MSFNILAIHKAVENQTEMEMKTSKTDDYNYPDEKSKDRSSYIDSFRLFMRILPAILDHLSDIPVLLTLWHRGYYELFWVGVAIDLLPGPVAVYQFYILK